VSPGALHNCGVTLLEDAYCWGANSNQNAGQLGNGTTTDTFVPTLVAGSFKFSRIASGNNHTCGLRTDGNAFCWGQNGSGQLGDGTTTARTSPTAVGGGFTFEFIGSGSGFSCALTAQPDGKVYCWGGISGVPQLTPITYTGAPAFTSLTVGGAHACALTADATAYCWGMNNFGQLGDSSTTRRNSPTRVAGDLRFTQISAGFLHTCGLTTNGAVACWGNNRSGELGEPPTSAAFRTKPRHVILGVTP
jgi:alpha-tubulin suppressor-like RCC1 family protein